MTRASPRLLAVLLLLGWGAPLAPGPGQAGGAAVAQDAPRIALRRHDLEVGGRMTEVVPVDVDGDRRLDLLVVRGREGLLYLQGADGGWPREPNQRFRFHPTTVLFDLADLDGDGAAEVVLLQPEGVSVYRLRRLPGGRALFGLRPEKLCECPTFLSRPVEDEVMRRELCRDLDGDGKLDLMVPQRDGFAVLRNLGQLRFAPPARLAAPPKATLHPGWPRISSQLFASYWFPNPLLCQFDGRDAQELVLAREGTLSVHAAPAPGELPLQSRGSWTIPDQKQFSMNAENPFELDFTMPLILRDLDGDGRLDASSTHVGQGTTRLFLQRTGDPAKDFSAPAQSVRVKGVTLLAFYVDLDGDGLLDLVLPRLDKINLWSVIKVFISRSVPVEVLFFFQRPGGAAPFADEPDDTREIEIPVSLGGKGEGLNLGTTIVANAGDFDGDGLLDLLHRTENDRLSFYRGVRGRRFEEQPSSAVEIPDVDPYRFCLAEVWDLDRDGKDDVLLRYTSWDRDGDRITVLTSGGKPR